MHLIDLTGKRFGRLVVLVYVGGRNCAWSCICDCGTRVVVAGGSLRGGSRTKSCGCLSRRIDLTGKRFSRWTVLAYVGDYAWSCICDCGTRAIVAGANLRAGRTRSCGCLCRKYAHTTNHGMSGTREYWSWMAMMKRCFDPRHHAYENYGGRGITVCEDWRSILAFFADMGPRPEGRSLDRINVNDDYRPDNCRWADAKQQTQNRRPQHARAKRRQVEPPPLDDPPF